MDVDGRDEQHLVIVVTLLLRIGVFVGIVGGVSAWRSRAHKRHVRMPRMPQGVRGSARSSGTAARAHTPPRLLCLKVTIVVLHIHVTVGPQLCDGTWPPFLVVCGAVLCLNACTDEELAPAATAAPPLAAADCRAARTVALVVVALVVAALAAVGIAVAVLVAGCACDGTRGRNANKTR